MTQVFVYGTLMPGQVRWPRIEPFARDVVPATARGRLWDTGLGYPAARFEPDAATIPGFVVILRPETVAAAIDTLDRIEGEGELFRRVQVETSAGPAVSYEWIRATDGLAPVPAGWPQKE